MKTYKIEDIELEEKKVHTNPDIYKLCIDKDVFFCGKKMHQEIYRKLINPNEYNYVWK